MALRNMISSALQTGSENSRQPRSQDYEQYTQATHQNQAQDRIPRHDPAVLQYDHARFHTTDASLPSRDSPFQQSRWPAQYAITERYANTQDMKYDYALEAAADPDTHRPNTMPFALGDREGLQPYYTTDAVHRHLLDNPYQSGLTDRTAHEAEMQASVEVRNALLWARPPNMSQIPNGLKLTLPVAIPQTQPGPQEPFSRAWCSTLARFDIREDEFLQFLDHLNVCKAPAPPLQVLNLAGSILGFCPIPYSTLVGMGTQAAAAGGTFVTAKLRIKHYLNAANQQYFIPRGLHVRIAKQELLPTILHQSPDAPLLPIGADQYLNSSPSPTALRDLRLHALQGYIASLEFENLPGKAPEKHMLDKMSSKLMTMKKHKNEDKRDDHKKDHKKDRHEDRRHKRDSGHSSHDNGHEGNLEPASAAFRFVWVIVEDLDKVVPVPKMVEQGKMAAVDFLQRRADAH